MPAKLLPLRDRNRLRTRQDLLDAALDLFDAGGFAVCSMDAVARQAGTSKTTAYTYFPLGIEEMLRDQYLSIADKVRALGEQSRNAGSTLEDRIVALPASLIHVCADRKVGRFYMMLTPALSPLLEPVIGQTSAYFKRCIAADLKDRASTAEAAMACATLIVGAGREAAIAVARDPAQRDVLLHVLRLTVRAMLSAKMLGKL